METRLALLALVLSACQGSGAPPEAEARADESPRAAGAGGVAVVELFTSEGCSSCPPADAVLGDAARDNPAVYALAFHVDYWDNLGWPDRFSSHDATARQHEYARSFGTSSLYTPQMIVGGTEQFTGADQRHAGASIARALSRPASVRLSLHAHTAAVDSVVVDFEAAGAPPDARVTVALLQHEATIDVRAGENAGRTLRHSNVVRAFTSVPAATSRATLTLPSSLRGADGEIVAFVQRDAGDGSGMPVLGAARTPLPIP
ncbi:MAG TPA: DUF1223 domain-containing protein [Polyangiaceae bacterium]|jgi:hypothetical protein|nr:DUF1223 domain-containing protein [Polyangiaceae bacterium]